MLTPIYEVALYTGRMNKKEWIWPS